MQHAPIKFSLKIMEEQCDNFSDYLLSDLRYLGNVWPDLPFVKEKNETTMQNGNYTCKFLLEKIFSLSFIQKVKDLFYWTTVTEAAFKNSESCREARASL